MGSGMSPAATAYFIDAIEHPGGHIIICHRCALANMLQHVSFES